MTIPSSSTDPNPQHPQYLEPSELGTREYWEAYYERSLEHIALKSKARTTTLRSDSVNIQDSRDDQDSDDEAREEDDDDDPGTSWFSEHDAPRKILRYLRSPNFPLSPRNLHRQQQRQQHGQEKRKQHPSILDLGTGNGSMLALLRKRGGYKGVMVGVDYSAQSVRLARELQRLRLHSAYESGDDDDDDEDDEEDDEEEVEEEEKEEEEEEEEGEKNIQFEEWDILDPANEEVLDQSTTTQTALQKLSWFPYESQGFDIVLDKGTFDAVSLSDAESHAAHAQNDNDRQHNKHICHQYPIVASKLVRPGGFLIITSCNWTEDELVRWFTAVPGGELTVWHKLEYPRFRFGGMEGQGVCTVCFRRRETLQSE